MKIAIAQIETYIGEFEKNCQKICSIIKKAKEKKSDIVIFPELSLIGYHPMDVLNNRSFYNDLGKFLGEIKNISKDIISIIGSIYIKNYKLFNAAFIFNDNNSKIVLKNNLKLYPPIYEFLYFNTSDEFYPTIKYKNKNIQVTIGNDIDFIYDNNFIHQNTDVIINITHEFYRENAIILRKQKLIEIAKNSNCHIVWVNGVGEVLGNVSFGNSMVITPEGKGIELEAFEEDFCLVDLEEIKGFISLEKQWEREVIDALSFGFKSYFNKTGLEKAVIGLSGGIDSSLSACIAKIGIGSDRLVGIAMPGPYSSSESIEDAKELAKRSGIKFHILPINSLYDMVLSLFKEIFKNTKPDITEENLQARIRAIILMTYSNKFKGLVINTGNKSEAAVGYATLYGDSIGGISLVGDLYKEDVYRLARYINEKYGWIPERVLSKPPSAELRKGQKDEDDIPPYDVLDKILRFFFEENLSREEIIKKGLQEDLVKEVFKRFCQNEYKRQQSPFCIKISESKFKRDTLPLIFKL